MGSEFGQFIEWNYKQELDWLLLKYPSHDSLREYCRALNFFYTENPELYEIDKSWDGFRWLNVDEKALSCIAFMRSGTSKTRHIVCACNFIPNENPHFTVGLPTASCAFCFQATSLASAAAAPKRRPALRQRAKASANFLTAPCCRFRR